jgi:uncharacterized iron-regulated membrane protein
MRKRIWLLIAALMVALTMSFGGVAFAKITPVPIECLNPAGQTPPGQQPECENATALQQVTENQNPAGKAPPGQNP